MLMLDKTESMHSTVHLCMCYIFVIKPFSLQGMITRHISAQMAFSQTWIIIKLHSTQHMQDKTGEHQKPCRHPVDTPFLSYPGGWVIHPDSRAPSDFRTQLASSNLQDFSWAEVPKLGSSVAKTKITYVLILR